MLSANKLQAITKGPPATQAQERAIKLRAMRAGSQIIDQIFRELLNLLKTKSNLTELQIANFIKREAKKMGAQGMAFRPIVAFGKRSVNIHGFATNNKIGRNNFLMLDYGVKIRGYCSDFTRTLFLGQPKKIHENIYNLVLKSQLVGIKKLSIGAYGDEIDFAARHIINVAGFGKYFIHGTGHGVEKKIHEAPSFKINSGDQIKKNDVVTIEPGIYLPGRFGVRIEDMIFMGIKNKVFSQIGKDFQSMIIK